MAKKLELLWSMVGLPLLEENSMIKIKKGFAIIELMIVVAIMAILIAAIAQKFRAPKEINLNNVIKVMVTSNKGYNSYKAVDRNGNVIIINEKDFGKLVSSGVEVIK